MYIAQDVGTGIEDDKKVHAMINDDHGFVTDDVDAPTLPPPGYENSDPTKDLENLVQSSDGTTWFLLCMWCHN